MKVTEYRIPLPVALEEFHAAWLYMVAKASKAKTKGSDGVEVLRNEPYHNEKGHGQYTLKHLHLGGYLPGFIRKIMPASMLLVIEEAWNGYPYCKTVYSNPFLGDRFTMSVESVFVADNKGTTENAVRLTEEELKIRDIVPLDIATDQQRGKDYTAEEDPSRFHSVKTGRGPLRAGWQDDHSHPLMCAYKVVRFNFRWWGLQTAVENYTCRVIRDVFLASHKQAFCWIDEWFGLTMADIRRIEAETAAELKKAMEKAAASGEALRTPPPAEEEAQVDAAAAAGPSPIPDAAVAAPLPPPPAAAPALPPAAAPGAEAQ